MKHEFHAQYSLFPQPDFAQREGVDFLTGATEQIPEHWKELGEVNDTFARLELLAQAISTPYKDYARVGTDKNGGLLHAISSNHLNTFFKQQYDDYLEPLKLNPTIPDLTIFPSGSWAINFNFKLQKPYLSKDDTDFYIIDNPIRKEWVFMVPYIAPSQWKGTLRSVMVQQLVEWWSDLGDDKQHMDKCSKKFVNWRIQLTRFFGNEKELGLEGADAYLDRVGGENLAGKYREQLESLTDTGYFAGQLHFYPTYFTRIGLEVINPHDRETGAGSQPIYFESVPTGTKGVFMLLYVPVDRIGEGDVGIDERSADNLCLVAEGLRLMLTEYGFGAKTSSGFGVVENGVENGSLVLNAEGIEFSVQAETVPEPPDKFHKYLNLEEGTVKEQFCEDDGKPMSASKYNKMAYGGSKPEGGGSQNEFKDFNNWYKTLGEAWSKSVQLKNNSSSAELPSYEFKNFNDLTDMANSFKGIVNEKGD
jgi:CRISPR-associated protein Cmr2